MKLDLTSTRHMLRFVTQEIRTPLSTITLGLKVLREDLSQATNVTAQCKERLDTVAVLQSCCDGALVLIDDMNYFDQLITEEMRIKMSDVIACDFLRDTLRPLDVEVRVTRS